jgi:hypothetical protein
VAGHRVRNTLVIGIVAIAAAAAALWFFVLSPRLNTVADITSQLEQVDFANTQLQNHYNQGVKLAQEAPQAAADAQALFSTMPEKADLPAVFDQLMEAATSAGIKPEDISVINATVPRPLTGAAPGTTTAAGASASNLGATLAQMDLDISAGGDKDALLKFVQNLQNLDRALLITATNLTSSDPAAAEAAGTPTDTVRVTGSMFVLQSQLPDLVANVDALLAKSGLNTPTTS